MQRVTKAQALAYLRQKGAPANVRQALGDYSESDPNTYPQGYEPNEREIFSAVPTGGRIAHEGGMVDVPIVRNTNSFTLYPFSTNETSGSNGSVSILPANQRRTFLLVQNQSAAEDLYFNFGADAGVNLGILLAPGFGCFFDIVCPYNQVNVYFDSSDNEPGVIIEGAPLT